MRTDYERLAGRYDEDRARWPFPPDDVVGEMIASRARVRVLDLGCGTGRWLVTQRDEFGDVDVEWLGADPSSAMLAKARAKGIGNLVRAAAEDLPLPEASIDYVVTSFAFHHFVDKDRALDEITRVLTADGVVGINNIEPAAADGWWLYEFFPEAIEIDAARFWPAGRIADALSARGLHTDVDLDALPQELQATDALADAQRRVVSQLALLDDFAYRRGLARLQHAAAVPGATVTTTRSRLRLIARRKR